jgi:ribosomal protein S27AE
MSDAGLYYRGGDQWLWVSADQTRWCKLPEWAFEEIDAEFESLHKTAADEIEELRAQLKWIEENARPTRCARCPECGLTASHNIEKDGTCGKCGAAVEHFVPAYLIPRDENPFMAKLIEEAHHGEV